MQNKVIMTKDAPTAIGPYSQGIIAGNMIFVSGQLGINPKMGEMKNGFQEQATQSLLNLKAILEKAGAGMQDVVKTTVFLKDMNDFSAMNEIYKQYFTTSFPARSAIEISKLPKDGLVEVEAIAMIAK
ncbi:RidA family protein [Pelosinus propionicus]|uniref:Endoribonuclease L-PSP n=1 Tax=Pelosinus propionicus DSM 13327 TaxID=1123291 RepID=A0A1I4NHB5_9FIRM|nr:RidA family protein [Pelosinus propionicus]SFM14687.1 endoribonuclease L-PSP [Pelosinus propionicus DSM 13327]